MLIEKDKIIIINVFKRQTYLIPYAFNELNQLSYLEGF